MSYGGGHRLDDVEPVLADHSWAHIEIRPPSTTNIHRVPLPNVRVYQSTDDVAPVPEPDWREEAVMIFEEEDAQIALEFTYARFQRLAEQGVHEVVVEPEQQEEAAAAALSQTTAAGSNRMRDLELIADHLNHNVNVTASADLVALAYDRNNEDVVNAITNLTEPTFRRQLERELAERIDETTQFFASREDEDIARAQEALTYAEEALGRSEARAWRSPDMWNRHQDAQRALRRFQGAMEEAVALRRREEENQESFVRRTQRAADVIASATQPTATQPTPVQYVQFLPNAGKSLRARELARASLTKEREDLEAQMERMEITEGVYLERMNALRDEYNRAPYGLALSADASTLAGNDLPFDVRPRVVETDINRALIDRAWPPYIVDRAALDDDEPPNNEIPEVD